MNLNDFMGYKPKAWTPPREPEVIPPPAALDDEPDPFLEAVEATLAPAPAGTRRVYGGGGL